MRIQVSDIIEENLTNYCIFCRLSFGLKVELIQNMEDIFFDFLEATGCTITDYEEYEW